jgi:hypothetical protein
MNGTEPSEQPTSVEQSTETALKKCSLACKEVVAVYLSEEEAPQTEFGRCLLRAAAAIDAAATAIAADADKRSTTFAIAAPLCHAAAEQCRRSGLDPRLLRTAAACERAAAICAHHLPRV